MDRAKDWHEASQRSARISSLADPRDRARLHARGRLGAAQRRAVPRTSRHLLELLASADPANAESLPTRFLWSLRDRLGSWFDLGRISASGRGAARRGSCRSRERAKPRCRNGCRTICATRRRTSDFELAAVHAALPHRRRVRRGDVEPDGARRDAPGLGRTGRGRYQAQMAVYVKPRGAFGRGYMALIKPFRYWIVYPALMRQTERMWNRRVPRSSDRSGPSRSV